MVRKKLDERIRTLIERGVLTNQRSILVLVGDHGKDQVPNLHQILTKTSIKARPKVLWCYKKELGFSTHRTKRMKKIKRDKARGLSKGVSDSLDQNQMVDNFELFLSSTDINWCYYRDTHRILGTTVGMAVLQDFEALTPNLMARTIETVEGGGLIIFLLRTVKSLKQLYTMTMDVHARFRTESSGDVIPRFNERFLLSLGKCENCLVCDDELNILPLSRKTLRKLGDPDVLIKIKKGDAGEVLQHKTKDEFELATLKSSLSDTPHVGALIDLAKTLDQARAVLMFLEACSEKTNKIKMSLTSARGRGKSAAIGLCLAGALSFGYSSIVVTAPEPENLVSVFEFILRGLKALKFQEHLDFSVTYDGSSGREQNKCIIAVEVHRDHHQSVKYFRPEEPEKFSAAEIVAIDEAAAIPLPTVRALMGDRLTFLSSTINGYEGTGRSLSLKLLKELREGKRKNSEIAALSASDAIVGPKSNKREVKIHEKRWAAEAEAAENGHSEGLSTSLREIELITPIRYSSGDRVEAWLNKLLCLDSGSGDNMKLTGGAPAPSECELYHVNRDALFSYHSLSEAFLQKLMGLYTSAHYKNTPNDLQILSDAPAHLVFVLLSPAAECDVNSIPDIIAVLQVALEGKISRKAVEAQLARGHRSAGDLIPWTISQQFGDANFAQLSGARIVRVAVHPLLQGMGYGSRAIELLYRYYNGEMISLSSHQNEIQDDSSGENISSDADSHDAETIDKTQRPGIQGETLIPRRGLPPLLLPLTEIKAPRLDWLGTSFGLTHELHRFWKRAGMHMLYLRQTKNELTGEFSTIMLRALPKRTGYDDAWLPAFVVDTQRRIVSLLAGPFRDLDIKLAIAILEQFESLTETSKMFSANKDAKAAIGLRSGLAMDKVNHVELNYFLTSHDLKRIELYGRNLCDHYLIADLLPALARLYFTGRMGSYSEFKLSSLQAALMCGLGLQNKTINVLAVQLGLPSNQVLAMFNKAIRKISIALNDVAETSVEVIGANKRLEAEKQIAQIKDVSRTTLQEDTEEAATKALETMRRVSHVPRDIVNDYDVMKFTIKGDHVQWTKALQDKDIQRNSVIQIQTTENKNNQKRKLDDGDIEKELSGFKTKSSFVEKSRKVRKKRHQKN